MSSPAKPDHREDDTHADAAKKAAGGAETIGNPINWTADVINKFVLASWSGAKGFAGWLWQLGAKAVPVGAAKMTAGLPVGAAIGVWQHTKDTAQRMAQTLEAIPGAMAEANNLGKLWAPLRSIAFTAWLGVQGVMGLPIHGAIGAADMGVKGASHIVSGLKGTYDKDIGGGTPNHGAAGHANGHGTAPAKH